MPICAFADKTSTSMAKHRACALLYEIWNQSPDLQDELTEMNKEMQRKLQKKSLDSYLMHSVQLQYTRQPTYCCKGCVFFLLFQLWHQDNLQTTQNVGRSMEAYATIFPPSHSSPSTIPWRLRHFALERESSMTSRIKNLPPYCSFFLDSPP